MLMASRMAEGDAQVLQSLRHLDGGRFCPAMGPPCALNVTTRRIAYEFQGEGALLVLVAGQANNHHWWDGIRDDFHPARSTLTLDYCGTGESDKPYSTEVFAQDVIAVLDELSIDRADVYGTSHVRWTHW